MPRPKKELHYCPTCGQSLQWDGESMETVNIKYRIPMSEFHVRCLGCDFPTAKSILRDGLCQMCCVVEDRSMKRKKGVKRQPPIGR